MTKKGRAMASTIKKVRIALLIIIPAAFLIMIGTVVYIIKTAPSQ